MFLFSEHSFCSSAEEDNQVPGGSGGGVYFSGKGPHEVSLGAVTPVRVPPPRWGWGAICSREAGLF